MGISNQRRFVQISLAAGLLLCSSMAYGKKAHPADPTVPTAVQDPKSSGVSGDQAAMADMKGKLQLAQSKVGKSAASEEPAVASSKQQLCDMYDRQESATQTALSNLHAAGSDSTRVTSATNAIQSAGDEVRTYLSRNPTVSSALTRRLNIINNELTMIANSPDKYVTMLKTAGLADPSLTQAKSIVKAAASRSGGKVDGDTTADVLSARTQVRGMLSSKQGAAMDSAAAGGAGASTSSLPKSIPSPTSLIPKLPKF